VNFQWRKSGKWIRRHLERRFDVILDEIAGGDPAEVRQALHARWLLDNSHLIRQAFQQVQTDLPFNYYRQLPTTTTEDGSGIPRVFQLVEQAIAASGLPLDYAFLETTCSQWRAEQTTAHQPETLTLGELWAVPTALRITLITRLCETAEAGMMAVQQSDMRGAYDDCVEMIAACISSLRAVATTDWSAFVERTSIVEQVLTQDPAGIYARMDFETRNYYRQAVERITTGTDHDQHAVALESLRLARTADDANAAMQETHVGYYLVDNGREQLEHAVDYRPALVSRFRRRLGVYRIGLYLAAIGGLAIFAGIALLIALRTDGASMTMALSVAFVALIPIVSISSGATNFVVSLLVPPRILPKLDFSDGVPAECATMVVVPMLLSSVDGIEENLKSLEYNYLGNAESELRFALLSDFSDAPSAETAADQILLDRAVVGIDDLNRRYSANGVRPFMLLHRRRLWNENARCWMGWERKRGKLEEFNAWLRGATDTSFVLRHGGELPQSLHIRYVITLDSDSHMPTGTAAKLIGTLAHPLNHARFDDHEDHEDRVVGGYTVIQPRLEINPVSGAETLFARIFAGDVMLDLYTHAVSDVYQDLFREAIFAGKGIYDVDAFRRCVDRQIATNSILSHDLLEGLLGRAGLASDVVVLENYPSNYLEYLKRLHRWVRGDWQLLPWLLTRKTQDSRRFMPGVIGRWQLFDNLRRSLVMPAILTLLVLGWVALPTNPVVWTLVFALFPGLPIILRITLALHTSSWRWGTIRTSVRNLLGHAGADAARWILALTFLPAEAYVATDAIARTIYRLVISRRRMLEWVTAAHVSRALGGSARASSYWRTLWFGPATAIVGVAAIEYFNPASTMAAIPLLASWLLSPLIALQLGRHSDDQPTVRLPQQDVLFARSIARDTWRFFERFVGPDTCWLPPDNVQEYPKRNIAARTSPTNIGMLLLSTLTAYDLGYLGRRQLLARLTSHMDSIQRMPKHRGHLLNWYSTRDLQPLEPHYVSTVDSGNLVASLIVVREALQELSDNIRPIEVVISALNDDLLALRRGLIPGLSQQPHLATPELNKLLDRAQAALTNSEDFPGTMDDFEARYCGQIEQCFLEVLNEDPHHWSAEQIALFRENSQVLRQRIRMITSDIELFHPWCRKLRAMPDMLRDPQFLSRIQTLQTLLDGSSQGDAHLPPLEVAAHLTTELSSEISSVTPEQRTGDACEWLREIHGDVSRAQKERNKLDGTRQKLLEEISSLIAQTDFGFLYDKKRHLFRVGYNASTGEADASYYDLLASEARIASFVAIAKGDVPARHWMQLGRPLTRIRGLRILLSWSATAFEYLMPRLIIRSPPGGLLNQSCEGIIEEQIRFGRKFGIPWGVSESGYAQLDSQGNYQYYAFGVPNLGLKWDQGERLVVSSYSSILAISYAPAQTLKNLHQLVGLGAAGHYGLYEALDFGDAHAKRPPRPRVVRSYMSHHQGMILVAIGNALCGDKTLHRFHRDPRIACVEHILYERLPQRIQTRPLERLPSPLKELPGAPATTSQWTVDPAEPELAILSNGRLNSQISDQGGGALCWRGTAITRWNPLSEGPASGSCVYLKDLEDDRLFSLGGEPLRQNIETVFAPHFAEFRAHRKKMLMRMTITVAPATDIEIRRITITNNGQSVKDVQLCSYSEPVLDQINADRRHPAFSKLFIESRFSETHDALLFRRRAREPGQSPVYLAHTVTTQSEYELQRQFETDRGVFFGRGNDRTEPALLRSQERSSTDESRVNLDPCAAIAITLRIPAGTTVQCAFLSSVGDSARHAMEALQQFSALERVNWSMETSRLHSEREMTDLRLDSDNVRAAFRLYAELLWPRTAPQMVASMISESQQVQDSLWRHGISGDHPVVTLRLDGEEDLKPAAMLLKNVSYLNHLNMAVDIVFLDETTGGYTVPVNDQLRKLVDSYISKKRRQHLSQAFIVPVQHLAANEKTNLIAASRIFIDSHVRTFGNGPVVSDRAPSRLPAFVPQPSAPLSEVEIAPLSAREDLQLECGYGGLLPEQDGYAMYISRESQTPAPWCNVLANPDFGSLVSESGAMCTWFGNSSEYRLTPWSNDAVLNRTGEAVYVRDEETGGSWPLTPLTRPARQPWRVTHGIGESLFEHNGAGLEQQLQVFTDPVMPLKYLRIRLRNRWQRERRLTVTYAVEWLLGNAHTFSRHLLVPDRDGSTGALLIRNAFDRHASDNRAFVTSSLDAHGVTCDGREFFGAKRSWSAPAALASVGLSDRVEPGPLPCAAYQVHVDMHANEELEFHFVLGAANNRETARDVIAQSRNPDWVSERHELLCRHWSDLLGTWHVETPDTAANAMINQWLLYQTVSSRLWGRIGFYQASGGYGFRDQLQDVLALLDARPEMAREQILHAASRQFEEGDVLHWWHESPLRGIRTRCADDLLWLAYAVIEYIEVTNDNTILRDTAPFLHGEPLGNHELERYAEYPNSPKIASIYEHCWRAIDARISFGSHGFPYIGTGDWNDGLNRVGEKGRGESVWMAWFLVVICRGFAPLCRVMDDDNRANHYSSVALELLAHTQESAWAGHWYLRGYYDDGSRLGAPGDESEIDLNAQTWAVLADSSHAAAGEAMRSVEDKLIDTDHRLIKLLSPPFDKTAREPGYIKSYPPGVRENGGQYTHAAVWAAWAAAEIGSKELAMRWFTWLNPLCRSSGIDDTEHYRLEPYVTPGDIYSVGPLAGRGGWSWYTGSAAWLYRFAVRRLLGLQRRGNRLFLRPSIPSASWPEYKAVFQFADAEYRFRIHQPADFEKDKLFIVQDGSTADVAFLLLESTGSHDVDFFPSDATRSAWIKKTRSATA
jgi:cyclic beta-1,2-glucan synthetase